jgi:hypothetical protein
LGLGFAHQNQENQEVHHHIHQNKSSILIPHEDDLELHLCAHQNISSNHQKPADQAQAHEKGFAHHQAFPKVSYCFFLPSSDKVE